MKSRTGRSRHCRFRRTSWKTCTRIRRIAERYRLEPAGPVGISGQPDQLLRPEQRDRGAIDEFRVQPCRSTMVRGQSKVATRAILDFPSTRTRTRAAPATNATASEAEIILTVPPTIPPAVPPTSSPRHSRHRCPGAVFLRACRGAAGADDGRAAVRGGNRRGSGAKSHPIDGRRERGMDHAGGGDQSGAGRAGAERIERSDDFNCDHVRHRLCHVPDTLGRANLEGLAGVSQRCLNWRCQPDTPIRPEMTSRGSGPPRRQISRQHFSISYCGY